MDERVGRKRAAGAHRIGQHLIATIAALVVIATLGVTTASAASTDCLVTNADTGETFTALQPAVDAASPGYRLTVEGTCHGTTTLTKDLLISGVETEASGPPTLDGDGLGGVLTVLPVAVTIEGLTIENGAAPQGGRSNGGGMRNRRGVVTLRDVTVHHNRARWGGGIYNAGTLTLAGASRISDNAARKGGGVYDRGTLRMNGTSSISENDAFPGSGVYLEGGTFVMNDRAAIRGNRWSAVFSVRGSVTMNDSSSIRGSTFGGGVRLFDHSALTMNDRATLAGNASGNGGGGVTVGEDSSLTMNGMSSITDNTARTKSASGGVYVVPGAEVVGVTQRGDPRTVPSFAVGGGSLWVA